MALAQAARETDDGLQQRIEQVLRPFPPALRGDGRAMSPGGPIIFDLGPARGTPPAQNTAGRVVVPPKGCPSADEISRRPGVVVPQITFEHGTAHLTTEATEILRRIGSTLNGPLADQKLFQIQAHTDAVGSFEANIILSGARAQAVKDFLVHSTGVTAERLQIVGLSYCNLINPANPTGAENRRIIFVNLSN